MKCKSNGTNYYIKSIIVIEFGSGSDGKNGQGSDRAGFGSRMVSWRLGSIQILLR